MLERRGRIFAENVLVVVLSGVCVQCHAEVSDLSRELGNKKWKCGFCFQ